MGVVLIFLAYGFGLACLLNFFLMQVRLGVTGIYAQRAQKRKAVLEGGAEAAAQAEEEERKRPLKVVFLHPDLGIGGAERLVLDMAVGLQRHQRVRPVEVTIVTPHHDARRCFPETVDGTVRVVVRGSWVPASVMGRAKVLCATLRMAVAALSTCRQQPDTDVFVVDQVAATMPVLKYFAGCTPILFYCHFPDQRCDPNRNPDGTFKTAAPHGPVTARAVEHDAALAAETGKPSMAHYAYRSVFDNVEALAMKSADSIVCNSRFSRAVTVDTFPEIKDRISDTEDIFYPPVAPPPPPPPASKAATDGDGSSPDAAAVRDLLARHPITFVSINRYERNKNVLLAVEAFAKVLAAAPDPSALALVIAGGYDPRLGENVEYFKEVEEAAVNTFKLPAGQFLLLRNVSDGEKQALLCGMHALLYTPANEHFGIVPVEAMMRGKPVVAVNHGGPCESVGDIAEEPDTAGGILCPPEASAFGDAMLRLVKEAGLAARLGGQGKERAEARFNIRLFSEQVATRLVRLRGAADDTIWDQYKEQLGWKEPAETAGEKAATAEEGEGASASKKDN